MSTTEGSPKQDHRETIVYLSGNYIKYNEAQVSIHDRGIVFGDGIYEAIFVKNGTFIDHDLHAERFKRSAKHLSLDAPEVTSFIDSIKDISIKLLRHNSIQTSLLYIQITRGYFEYRMHNTPSPQKPTFFINPNPSREVDEYTKNNGISCITYQDIRWRRRDIKSTNMLGNIMGKHKAATEGCQDCIFYEEDTQIATEGGSSNLFMAKDGALHTHPESPLILSGITRARVMKLCQDSGVVVKEKPFTKSQLYTADEVILTNSGSICRSVTTLDGQKIGDGKVGPISQLIIKKYLEFVASLTPDF